ncbi:MAG: hypothetical protein O3B31_11195 [Chloroflexi bacterium]|nr:hypothetical protein [Chloroflexota bacterium]MDA1003891.1 hypothetical protein [Chloroflexota bacterium]
MSQAIADLAILLSMVTGADRAREAIDRALRETGLSHARTISDDDLELLLTSITADGGPLEQFARQIAMAGLDADGGAGMSTRITDPSDRSAA